jgi:hypothetical protein
VPLVGDVHEDPGEELKRVGGFGPRRRTVRLVRAIGHGLGGAVVGQPLERDRIAGAVPGESGSEGTIVFRDPKGSSQTAVCSGCQWARDPCVCRHDNRNAPSKRAALRFGFTAEGVFRKHLGIKGQNRDTAWFAMTDDDWPVVRSALAAWLAPDNFDANGAERRALTATRDAP